MALLRAVLVVMVVAGVAHAEGTERVEPVPSSAEAAGGSAALAPAWDLRSPPPPPPPRARHHLVLWLWGGLGLVFVTSLVVSAYQQSAPRPMYGNSTFAWPFP